MTHYDFNKDLKDGQYLENKILEIFIDNQIHARLINSRSYDMVVIKGDITIPIEIKNDIMSGYTDNVAIEFEYNTKPSGIQTTEADYWFISIGGEIYSFSVDILQHLIFTYKYIRIIKGGDDKKSLMYLFGKDFLIEYGEKLEEWIKWFHKI